MSTLYKRWDVFLHKSTPDRITPAGGFCTVTISYICDSFIICSFAAVCRARA